jgi:AbiV family abortive infection protein
VTSPKRLTWEQAADVSLSALANARRLYDDAKELDRSGQSASSFILAGLAADELGKHILVASFAMRDQSDAEWKKFWRRFRTHQEKLGDSLLSAWIGDLMTDDDPPDVEAFHQRRLIATYVDVLEDGTVTRPIDAIPQEELHGLLDRLAQELEFCERLLHGATPSSFGLILERLRDSEAAGWMHDLQQKHGQMALMAFGIAARSGMNLEEALEFAATAPNAFKTEPSANTDHPREAADD